MSCPRSSERSSSCWRSGCGSALRNPPEAAGPPIGSAGAESLDHGGRERRRADACGVVLVARRPHPRLAALDPELAVNRHAVRHVEARAAAPPPPPPPPHARPPPPPAP